jgi:hypothetical protein
MSTPVSKDYLTVNTNRFHEIEWIKAKIRSLENKYLRRPSTIKEIRDLERQIKERGGEPEVHTWMIK